MATLTLDSPEYMLLLNRLDRAEAEMANMREQSVSFQPQLWIPPITPGADGDIFNWYISYWGGLFNRILRFSTARVEIVQYPGTATGMTNAIAAAETNDTYWMPNRTITGDYTLPADSYWIGIDKYGAILTGEITLSSNTSIINLSVVRSADSADDIKGVIATSSGTSYIKNCLVSVTQAGAGGAWAVNVEGNGSIETMESYLIGNSTGGTGYAVYHAGGGATGNSYQYGGRGYGSTDYTNVNV